MGGLSIESVQENLNKRADAKLCLHVDAALRDMEELLYNADMDGLKHNDERISPQWLFRELRLRIIEGNKEFWRARESREFIESLDRLASEFDELRQTVT